MPVPSVRLTILFATTAGDSSPWSAEAFGVEADVDAAAGAATDGDASAKVAAFVVPPVTEKVCVPPPSIVADCEVSFPRYVSAST
jgi:hypothetical protein